MESSFDFLNRSVRPQEEQVRHLLESWYRKYPTEDNQHLAIRERFQSDGADHDAAFFELYCYALLRYQRFSITLEPPMPNVTTHIDFLACKGKKHTRCFRFEATVVGDAREEAAVHRNLIALRANLNQLNSPIFRFSIGVLHGSRVCLTNTGNMLHS